MFSRPSKKDLLSDVSLWVLIFSNIVTIVLALTQGWDLSTLLWIYWFQSVTIGFFNFVRILQLREFSTEGFYINDKQAEPTQSTKYSTAFFFLFHYGFFHFVYLVFLLGDASMGHLLQSMDSAQLKYIFSAALLFFINHLFSYVYNRPHDTKKQNIGSLMFYPYARIIPMHFTIILGLALPGAILFFLILKTVSDAVMHVVEHSVIRR